MPANGVFPNRARMVPDKAYTGHPLQISAVVYDSHRALIQFQDKQ